MKIIFIVLLFVSFNAFAECRLVERLNPATGKMEQVLVCTDGADPATGK